MRSALLLLSLVAAPALAQSVPTVVYPVGSDEFQKSEVAEAQGLLIAAVLRMRSRAFLLSSTDPLPPSCGPAQKAQASCLAKLAGKGVVLRAVLRKGSERPILLLEAVDARAVSVGPVRVPVDPLFQSAKTLVEAVDVLAAQMADARSRSP